jgi:hypothetical protein
MKWSRQGGLDIIFIILLYKNFGILWVGSEVTGSYRNVVWLQTSLPKTGSSWLWDFSWQFFWLHLSRSINKTYLDSRNNHNPVPVFSSWGGRVKREGGENPSHSGRCCDPEIPLGYLKRHAMFRPSLKVLDNPIKKPQKREEPKRLNGEWEKGRIKRHCSSNTNGKASVVRVSQKTCRSWCRMEMP